MAVPPVLLRGLTPLLRQQQGRKSLAARWSFIVGWVSADTRAAGGWPRYARWHAIYRFEVFLSAAIGLAAGLGWAATGFGYFWPGWLWFALAVPLVIKHSSAAAAWVDLRHQAGVLSVVVGDNGAGGASIDGGTGLRGVVRRLESFDGTVTVTSPAGGPTTVTMEVPCELSSPKT